MADRELSLIVIILCLILWQVADIRARLKERFPTEKEQDHKWALRDPMGHAEFHEKDNK